MTAGHHERAWALLYELRRPADAERVCRDGLAADPDDPTLLVLMAEALRRQEKVAAALAAVQDALAAAPGYPFAHFTHGAIQYDRRNYRAALAGFTEAARLNPADPATADAIACALLALGRPADAVAAAERGLALDPTHVGCMNRRAVGLAARDCYGQARTQLTAALRLAPTDPETHCNLGWFAAYSFRPLAAVRHYLEALRLAPTDRLAVSRLRTVVAHIAAFGVLTVGGLVLVFLTVASRGLDGQTRQVADLALTYATVVGLPTALVVLLSDPGRAVMLSLSPLGRKLRTDRDRRRIRVLAVLLLVACGAASVGLLAGKWFEGLAAATVIAVGWHAALIWARLLTGRAYP